MVKNKSVSNSKKVNAANPKKVVELTNKRLDLINTRVVNLNIGDRFIVRDLLEDIWGQISHPKQFGIEFKKAVDDGRIKNLRFISSEQPPRHNLYEKV